MDKLKQIFPVPLYLPVPGSACLDGSVVYTTSLAYKTHRSGMHRGTLQGTGYGGKSTLLVFLPNFYGLTIQTLK